MISETQTRSPRSDTAIAITKPVNILYFGCHEMLEYDDLRMFTDRGHRVFSLGSFSDPNGLVPAMRPRRPKFFHSGDWANFTATGCDLMRKRVTREFVRGFDVIVVNHDPGIIADNLAAFGDTPVIFRSLGQANAASEAALQAHLGRVTVVRYSAKEVGLPGFARSDAVIYFGKYMDEFPVWRGGKRARTFHTSFPTRDGVSVPSLDAFDRLAARHPVDLYGYANEGIASARGIASTQDQFGLYQTSAAYLYVYSVPPSYTLSLIEAMAVGVPVLAPTAAMVERTLGLVAAACGFSAARYEVEDLLDHDTALLADDPDDADRKLAALIADPAAQAAVSARLRAKAREMFDVRKIAPEWERLFANIC